MALLEQVMVIDQRVLVGENCHQGHRPGHDDQNPGPENRCPMGRRRWYPLLSLSIRNRHGLHQTPPCSERQAFCKQSIVLLSTFAPLSVNSAKHLAADRERPFAALRVTPKGNTRVLALALHPNLGGAVAARITHLVGTGWTSRLFAKINVELLVDPESPGHRVAIHL